MPSPVSPPEPRNPYEPPGAAVQDREPPRAAPVKAVVYGVLIDVGGSIAAGILLVVVYSMGLSAAGASLEEIERAMRSDDPTSAFSILGLLVGCTASFLGGHVCARVARAAEMKWVGVVAAVSGVVSLLTGMSSLSMEWNAVLALAGMGAVFAGGWTGAKRNRRSA